MHALLGCCGWPLCDPTSATDANITEEEIFLAARLSCSSGRQLTLYDVLLCCSGHPLLLVTGLGLDH